MATTIQSRKAKGRKLQQETVDILLENFSELSKRDVRSVSMGAPGADILLSEKASKIFPFSVECKNQEKINIWSSLLQAENNTKERDLTPLLIFKKNRSKIYCVLEIGNFIKLVNDCK